MTVQEIMERTGMNNTTMTISMIKDAINLIQSNQDIHIASWKTNIVDGTREYPFPANMIRLKSVSVLDTNDDKWKKIRRITHDPIVTEDGSPD